MALKKRGGQRSHSGRPDPVKLLLKREGYVPIRTGRRAGISAQPAIPRPYPMPIPPDFLQNHPAATEPEWAIYWAHGQLGLVEGLDFIYQDSVFKFTTSSASIDFVELDPTLVIEIQGTFSHYKLGSAKLVADQDRRAILESEGFPVVFIDEDDAERNPVFYLTDALRGIDHSKGVGF